ncbi:MAG: HAMP domain-containing histidine kinase [Firmicutes bacterium]|nr:HAMP domain-containing histidine kinase [Bacillota bacterium]
MPELSDKNPENWNQLRKKIIGLGETSLRKSHYPAFQQRQAENETIRMISELFLDVELLEDVLKRLPQFLSERFKYPLAAITLINKHTGRLEIISKTDNFETNPDIPDEELIVEISSQTVATGTTKIIGKSSITEKHETNGKDQKLLRIVCAPLKTKLQCIGTILLADIKDKPETESGINTLKVIANYLAQEINRKQTETELQETNRELSDYVYIVTNFLKNPLFTIKGYLYTIKDEPESLNEHFDRIIFQADKMIGVLEKLVQLSRAGKLKLRKETIEVSSHIQAVFNLIKPEDIRVKLNIENDIPSIRVDQGSIIQIFSSLLQNSIDFADPDKDELIINISGYETSSRTHLNISDNGLGIKPAIIEKVFNPGFTMGKKTGAGFGLAIAKKLMDAHGGRISIYSGGEKQGTEFQLHFPK